MLNTIVPETVSNVRKKIELIFYILVSSLWIRLGKEWRYLYFKSSISSTIRYYKKQLLLREIFALVDKSLNFFLNRVCSFQYIPGIFWRKDVVRRQWTSDYAEYSWSTVFTIVYRVFFHKTCDKNKRSVTYGKFLLPPVIIR